MEHQETEPQKEKIVLNPQIIALVGLPLSGKTTLAKELTRQTNARAINVDDVRAELFPDFDPQASRDKELDDRQMKQAHIETQKRVKELITCGEPAIYPGVFSSEVSQQALYNLAEELKAPLTLVYLETNDKDIKERIIERQTQGTFSSVTTIQEYNDVKNGYESPLHKTITINTSDYSIEEAAQGIVNKAKEV